MHYLGLVLWIVSIVAVVAWGQTFKKRSYDLMGLRKYFFALSALVTLLAVGSLVTNGLKKGLDFTGGSIIEVGAYKQTSVTEVNQAMAKFSSPQFKVGSAAVQTGTELVTDPVPEEGKPDKYQRVILRLTNEQGTQLEPAQTREVFDHLQGELGDLKELRTASIGPTISGELTNNAAKALLLALGLQLVYIFFRFGNQLRYGLAADIGLVHDVVIMLGVYSLSGREIDSPFIAALLTVVGYSVMDSVVIFDRIRENLNNWWEVNGEDEDAPYERIVNESVNETMTRSINTTLTTLLTLLTIFYFGGETLQNFAFSLLVGIVCGAYSSICLASPLLVEINKKYPAKPPTASAWGSVDDEVVPEDFLEDDDDYVAPKKPQKQISSPKLVEDDVPSTGGRRRQRGKRS